MLLSVWLTWQYGRNQKFLWAEVKGQNNLLVGANGLFFFFNLIIFFFFFVIEGGAHGPYPS
jgi:hypothetical protein